MINTIHGNLIAQKGSSTRASPIHHHDLVCSIHLGNLLEKRIIFKAVDCPGLAYTVCFASKTEKMQSKGGIYHLNGKVKVMKTTSNNGWKLYFSLMSTVCQESRRTYPHKRKLSPTAMRN
jgi:hypothetical protein